MIKDAIGFIIGGGKGKKVETKKHGSWSFPCLFILYFKTYECGVITNFKSNILIAMFIIFL